MNENLKSNEHQACYTLLIFRIFNFTQQSRIILYGTICQAYFYFSQYPACAMIFVVYAYYIKCQQFRMLYSLIVIASTAQMID